MNPLLEEPPHEVWKSYQRCWKQTKCWESEAVKDFQSFDHKYRTKKSKLQFQVEEGRQKELVIVAKVGSNNNGFSVTQARRQRGVQCVNQTFQAAKPKATNNDHNEANLSCSSMTGACTISGCLSLFQAFTKDKKCCPSSSWLKQVKRNCLLFLNFVFLTFSGSLFFPLVLSLFSFSLSLSLLLFCFLLFSFLLSLSCPLSFLYNLSFAHGMMSH